LVGQVLIAGGRCRDRGDAIFLYAATTTGEKLMKKVIRGSCLCGGVRFEVEPPLLRTSHCHCQRCRKHSGTAVCTQARVLQEQFRLLQGKELIRVYGKGECAVKAFWVNCGSSLFGGDWPDGQSQQSRLELGCVSAVDCEGRTIWIADAHRGDGKRLVVHADEKLTAFVEFQSVVRAAAT
jgi:hypothetical protein